MKELMYHTVKDVKKEEVSNRIVSLTLTGCQKGLKVKDKFMFNGTIIQCSEIIEQRNHKGFFKNESDRENSYFKAKFIAA